MNLSLGFLNNTDGAIRSVHAGGQRRFAMKGMKMWTFQPRIPVGSEARRFALLGLAVMVASSTGASVFGSGCSECGVVDCGCAPAPTHRVEYRTVYEEQPVTTYRLKTETAIEERQVTTNRPVIETSYREHRYRVARPVTETAYREEQYTLMRPVHETHYRDASYDRVRYVTETSTRTERRVVNRPVVETQMREEKYVVQRPVVQTMYQDQVQTTLTPVTTFRQQIVDQGQYVNQQQYVPGPVRNRLQWLPGTCYTDPATGRNAYRRTGLYWVPTANLGTYQTQRIYVPNPTMQQVAETSYVPQQVVQKIPVQVTQLQSEVQCRQVPVSVTRIQQEEEFRQVPVSVQRPIVERVEQKIPVTVCRWEPQTMVRRVPVTTQRYEYEEKVEQVPVRTCRTVSEVKTVEVPVTRSHWVAETSTRLVAKRVYVRVPIDPCTGAALETPSAAALESGTLQPTPADERPSLKDGSETSDDSETQSRSQRPLIDPDAGLEAADRPSAKSAPFFELEPSERS